MENRKIVYLKANDERDMLESELRSVGWETFATSSVSSARAQIDRHGLHVGLVALDRDYLNQNQQAIDELLISSRSVQWVGLTQPTFLEEAVQRRLIPGCLFDFHTLPVDKPRLINSLGHAYGMARVSRTTDSPELEEYSPELVEIHGQELVGGSPAMRQVFQDIAKIASVDAPVMITGESGTGKELAARSIHSRSHRGNGPFVALNCAALPGDLIQSELFGHEKGSFTGAHRRKTGRIEAANGGTFFLDEIGDLSLDLQVSLLRFLQEQMIERVGGDDPIPVDVRVITATHVDLTQAILEHRFREDLFYRLNVLYLQMPTLRERPSDIELLANYYFRDKFQPECRHDIRGFSRAAIQSMRSHTWPGNVRELVNRVRRATVMCEKRLIGPSDLGLGSDDVQPNVVTLSQARNEAEKKAIETCLYATGNNVSEAARRLDIARVTLYRLMEKYRLNATKVH